MSFFDFLRAGDGSPGSGSGRGEWDGSMQEIWAAWGQARPTIRTALALVTERPLDDGAESVWRSPVFSMG